MKEQCDWGWLWVLLLVAGLWGLAHVIRTESRKNASREESERWYQYHFEQPARR